MSDLNTIVPKTERTLAAESKRRAPEYPKEDPKQRRLMVGSLCLLLLALSIVLWQDRDFWFHDTPEASSVPPVESAPAAKIAPAQPSASAAKPLTSAKPKHQVVSEAKLPAASAPPPPMAATATRTVLPPLEVEVVAGDTHRTVRPGTTSVHVDLQPGAPAQPSNDVSVTSDTETAAKVTSSAAERVQMSTDASDIVASPVRPNYPLLARQMKVQGSVILQALIGKDGIIQNLRVVSGPHILASAAQDAVRQWHFKPHLEGSEAVETQAKITVNFTISTN
jgi:TonB family protein